MKTFIIKEINNQPINRFIYNGKTLIIQYILLDSLENRIYMKTVVKTLTAYALISMLFLIFLPVTLPAGEIKFAVLSDIHYAATEQDNGLKMVASGKKILPDLLKEIDKRSDINFVVFTGDLVVNPYNADLKELKTVLDSNLSKPYYILPGNHDRSMNRHKDAEDVFTLTEFVQTFKGHPYENTGKSYWSDDFNGFHLIGLDTTQYDTWGGAVSQKQVNWLKKDLKKNKKKFTIIFAHHQMLEFYPELKLFRELFIENSEEMLNILSQNPQVKFIVAGHTHFPAAIFRNGVHHLSVPSIVTYPCEYAIMDIDSDEVKFETVQVGDEKFLRKAADGAIKKIDWKKQFNTPSQLLDIFDGINSYSFKPRSD